MIQKIDNATVREAVQQAYERCKNETGGKNADYIPYLANVPSNLFGIAACLPDGEVIAVGDTDYKFGIESVSKVPTAILAMNQYSAQEMLDKIVKGSRVLLNSGMLGNVVEVREKTFVVEIADKVQVEVVKNGVADVVEEQAAAEKKA